MTSCCPIGFALWPCCAIMHFIMEQEHKRTIDEATVERDIVAEVLKMFEVDDLNAINSMREEMVLSEGIASCLDEIWGQYLLSGFLHEKKYISGAIATYSLFKSRSGLDKIDITHSYTDSFLQDFNEKLNAYKNSGRFLPDFLKDTFSVITLKDEELSKILKALSGIQFDESVYLGGYIVYKLFEKYRQTLELTSQHEDL